MVQGPNYIAAVSVAAALNGTWPAQVEKPTGFRAEATRFPKMKREDLRTGGPYVYVVPATPYSITVENRGDAVNREAPINVLIVDTVAKQDYAQQERLFALLDSITEVLLWLNVPGFGYPDGEEGIEAEWDPEELNVNGVFFAVVSALYGTTEEAAE